MTSLLPPNATKLERDLESVTSRIGSIELAHVSDLWNPDTCPADLLPWLAWAEGLDEWSSYWTVGLQRAVINAHRQVRRRRGTLRAVLDSVAALSGHAEVREWFEHVPKMTPGTFEIVIAGSEGYVESELQQSMIRAIDRNKRANSHYTLGVGLNFVGQVNVCGYVRVANYTRRCFTE